MPPASQENHALAAKLDLPERIISSRATPPDAACIAHHVPQITARHLVRWENLTIYLNMTAGAAIPENKVEATERTLASAIDELCLLAKALGDFADLIFSGGPGGPGLARRLVSILMAFVTSAIASLIRHRATHVDDLLTTTVADLRRHVSRPPARWAAP